MTDEPLDLAWLRSRHGIGQRTIYTLCDEIERLRGELAAANRLSGEQIALAERVCIQRDALQARIDATRPRLQALRLEVDGSIVDHIEAALTGEAS